MSRIDKHTNTHLLVSFKWFRRKARHDKDQTVSVITMVTALCWLCVCVCVLDGVKSVLWQQWHQRRNNWFLSWFVISFSARVFKHVVPHVSDPLRCVCMYVCVHALLKSGFMGLCVCTVWFVVLQHLFMTAWIITRLQCDFSSLEWLSHLKLLATQSTFTCRQTLMKHDCESSLRVFMCTKAHKTTKPQGNIWVKSNWFFSHGQQRL